MGNSNDVCRWCCMITLLVLDAFCVINNRVTVNTKLGRVIGTIEMIGLDDGHETKSFYAFKGVPFARPPIGDLRWNVCLFIKIAFTKKSFNLYFHFSPFSQNPLPYEKWPDVLNATTFGSSCPQFDRHSHSVVGNEDCLYLNIYTTSLPRTILDLVQSRSYFLELFQNTQREKGFFTVEETYYLLKQI